MISHVVPSGEHRKIKASLRALRDPDWIDRLPLVLGWNNAIREDFLHSPSRLLHSTSTRLPIDFFEHQTTQLIDN